MWQQTANGKWVRGDAETPTEQGKPLLHSTKIKRTHIILVERGSEDVGTPARNSFERVHVELRAQRETRIRSRSLNGKNGRTSRAAGHRPERPPRRHRRPKPPSLPVPSMASEETSRSLRTNRAPPLPPRPNHRLATGSNGATPSAEAFIEKEAAAKVSRSGENYTDGRTALPLRYSSEPVQQASAEQDSRRQEAAYLVAKYSFSGRTSVELSFITGDRFRVLTIDEYGDRQEQENFLILKHVKSGRIGYVPLNYVAPLVPHREADLHVELPIKEQKEAPQPPQHKSDRPVPNARQGSFHSFNDRKIYASAIARHNGYATDVIAIRGRNGELSATDFNVRFTGASKRSAHRGSGVDVKIDGNTCLSMLMGEGGMCFFPNKSLQCSDKELSSISCLQGVSGRHELIYEHKFSKDGEFCVNFVRAFLWVWDYSDNILVSDVDGTITISDVGGMLNSTLLSKVGFRKGYAHAGVCSLFNAVKKATNCHVLYLTARPMNLIKETREYIYGLQQNTDRKKRGLPVGPIITDTTDLLGSLHKEVISGSSHVFKTRMLLQLRACFLRGGRDVLKFPVYIASFGNKNTDVIAYQAAGVSS